MPEIKAIILDYDGVIVDSLKSFMHIFNSLAKKYKYKPVPNKEDFVKLFDRDLFAVLQNIGLSKLKIPMYVADLKKNLKESNKKIKTFPGMTNLLSVLSEHSKLAVVSYNFKDIITPILIQEKLKDKVSVIVAEEPGLPKSKKIRKCLEQLGVKPAEAVFVTDTFGDVMEGKEAHITTIAVTWGYQLRPKILPARPDFIVDKPSELLEALNVITQG